MASKGYRIQRAIFRILLFLVILIAIYFLVKPLAVIDQKIAKLMDENARIKAEKRRIETDISRLEADIEKGKTLAGYEQKARERLQMVYDGEQIYICKDSQGLDLKPDNEIDLIQTGVSYEKTIFQKIWDMILNVFRL